jgi:hypothetical protein
VARAATRVEALEGVQRITVTDEGIVVLYDPTVVTAKRIADAFYLQGLAVWL